MAVTETRLERPSSLDRWTKLVRWSIRPSEPGSFCSAHRRPARRSPREAQSRESDRACMGEWDCAEGQVTNPTPSDAVVRSRLVPYSSSWSWRYNALVSRLRDVVQHQVAAQPPFERPLLDIVPLGAKFRLPISSSLYPMLLAVVVSLWSL